MSQNQAKEFAELVDSNIKNLNMEYKAKRDSFRLNAPVAHRLQPNSFAQFKEYVLKQTGQDASRFKPNVLSQKDDLHEAIRNFSID